MSGENLRIGINGGAGRMGMAVHTCLQKLYPQSTVIIFDSNPGFERLSPSSTLGLSGILDFSSPEGFTNVINTVSEMGIPLVSGTTGISEHQHDLLTKAAEVAPVIWASNYSRGIALMKKMAALAAKLDGFDVEIVEIHHKMKKDAPSGTALTLAQTVKSVRKEMTPVYGRSGIGDVRSENEIGIMALRGGTVTGEHRMYFFGESEHLEIAHHSESRNVLAMGAVLALEWLLNQSPGLYTFEQAIGLED